MKKLLKISLTFFFTLIIVLGFALPLNQVGNWYQQFMPDIGSQQINDITFLDSLKGFAIASRNIFPDTSSILRTTNCGDSWQVIQTLASRRFSRIKFVNNLTGFISGGSGSGTPYLYKSIDGGNTWNIVTGATLGNAFWGDMAVISVDTIWLTDANSLNGGVFRTTDGGASWEQQLNIGSLNPNHIYFYNGRLGFICEDNMYLRKTSDGGANWQVISGNGDCQTILYNDNGTQVWRSTNNGGSLENLAIDVCTDASENVYITGQINNTLSNVDLLAVKYDNRGNKIWAASYDYEGSYDAGFGIAKDLNGNIDIIGTCGFASQTESDFWIMQVQSGSLDKPKNILENTVNSYNYLLDQNFPNPFNPNTVIQYSVPKDGYVYLKIFDILGREVSTIVNGVRTAGNYSVKFNGENLPSGVYFYKLNAGSFTDVKK